MDFFLSNDADVYFIEENTPIQLLVFKQHLTFDNCGFISHIKKSFCRKTQGQK